MAAVLRLVEKTNKETIEVLEWVLQEAKAGRINGLRIGYQTHDGREFTAFTGTYEDRTKVVLSALQTILDKLAETP